MYPNAVPARPFDHIALDFITFLPLTTSGYDCILTVVDRFSKLVTLIPTTVNVSAADTARLLFDHIICKFGVPSKIICDRDPRF